MGGRKSPRAPFWDFPVVLLLLSAISATAAWWHFKQGFTLYYGDAQAHLTIARRIFDSRTPGFFQFGTGWLPLPHALLLPFVGNDEWWQTGLAGVFPGAACFVIGGMFLYAAARRVFQSREVAAAAVLLYALNPNLLYLQSAPMTEPVFLACTMAMLYFTVWYASSQSVLAMLLTAIASNAASLTRYDGWFLIPFLTLFFFVKGTKNRWIHAMLFASLASIGPLLWIQHNIWYYGDPLEFYRGAWSAKAIYQRLLDQGMDRYPGDHEWGKAIVQLSAAARLCAGVSLALLGLAGIITTLVKRAFWPLTFVLLPVIFYVLSIYSSGTPIYVPYLWPFSYNNTRYGFAAFPLFVFCAASLVSIAPHRWRKFSVPALVLTAMIPWLANPRPEAWITWKESQVNSEARRTWTHEAAAFMAANYRHGSGIYTTIGDLIGIFREAGIPIRELLQECNQVHWEAVRKRPDLFLWEEWAVAFAGDDVATAIMKASKRGPRFECVKMISVKGAPVIEIYRRQSSFNENTVYQGAWREE